MAHFHVKKKNGRPYLYVREIARVDGKPKVVTQTYIGTPEKVAELAKQAKAPNLSVKLKVEQFGALWLALQIEDQIDLAGLIDSIVPSAAQEKGPSIGEYFLAAMLNRMVSPASKNALADWFKTTAIQLLRPMDIDALNSQRYWEKWDRVSEEQLSEIAKQLFQRIIELEPTDAEGVLFDTTNYYTFMSGSTDSKLAKRGNNKAGRHNLRQIGVSLLVDKAKRLPLWYRLYPGNMHDSKLFGEVMDEMFGAVCGLTSAKQLTVVIDKGMNSEDNFAHIDDQEHLHFLTTYSTYFEQELASTPLDKFQILNTPKNQQLVEDGKEKDQISAFRAMGEYWGKLRRVIVTHNPKTARKKEYVLASKLDTLSSQLAEMQGKVNSNAPQWRAEDKIRKRFDECCRKLHIPSDLYELKFTRTTDGKLNMWYNRNTRRINAYRASFGRNIIITDHMDWTSEAIVDFSQQRWKVEDQFRNSKSEQMVGMQPIYHWTDSKIRCHVFTCIAAMAYLRLIELRLQRSKVKMTAKKAMKDMAELHSVMTILNKKPARVLEQPTKTQVKILKAFGHKISNGVLQAL